MKGKKVLSLRCHIGIYQFAGLQSIDQKRLGKEGKMEMNALGVVIRGLSGDTMREVFVPYSNIVSIEIEDESSK